MALLRIVLAVVALSAGAAFAQEEAGEKVSAPPVQITFTPPDIDGRIVLGIFDEAGKLVRTLKPHPDSLKIDTNGYIAEWDGLDESGKRCAGGRYEARGYIVGDAVEIEGEAYHFNDWLAIDGVPVTAVMSGSPEKPFSVRVDIAGESSPRVGDIDAEGTLTWRQVNLSAGANAALPAFPDLPVETLYRLPGANETWWVIFEENGQNVVSQVDAKGEALREFREPVDEPQPVELQSSATDDDAILLREESKAGEVRMRMLRKSGATEELGKTISDWEVVFERSMTPCKAFGLADGKLVPNGEDTPPDSLEVDLVENALEPGAHKLQVTAGPDGEGSALFSPEGLELLPISTSGNWNRFAVAPGAKEGEWTIYQGNGIGVEEFSVRNLSEIAGYDAGSFLLAPEEE